MAGKLIYGLNAVREALRCEGLVNRVYLAIESRAHGAGALADAAREQGVPFDFVPQAKLNELTHTWEHQGVVAMISPVLYTPLETCLKSCPKQATLLVLDQVQHPKNLGLIVRTAVGAGASGILLPARGGALLDDSVVRSSTGAVFHIPIVNCRNLTHALPKLKDSGFWVYGLDGHAHESLFDVSWPDRCALVLGNETHGVRPGVRKLCDALIRIPLANDLDSLNVAVAAGIALFQVATGRGKGLGSRV